MLHGAGHLLLDSVQVDHNLLLGVLANAMDKLNNVGASKKKRGGGLMVASTSTSSRRRQGSSRSSLIGEGSGAMTLSNAVHASQIGARALGARLASELVRGRTGHNTPSPPHSKCRSLLQLRAK